MGPYISQFLMKTALFGAEVIPQRITTTPAGSDFMTASEWLDVQRGTQPGDPPYDPTRRYIRNGRDISQYGGSGPLRPECGTRHSCCVTFCVDVERGRAQPARRILPRLAGDGSDLRRPRPKGEHEQLEHGDASGPGTRVRRCPMASSSRLPAPGLAQMAVTHRMEPSPVPLATAQVTVVGRHTRSSM
jgi:hypothetical protein